MKKILSLLLSFVMLLTCCLGVGIESFAAITGTSISSLSSTASSVTVKWKKQTSGTSGYQIRYSLNSNMNSSKIVTISKNTTVSKTVSKLKSDKTYYFQVRTYKNNNSKKSCSKWSAKKSIKTKKATNSTVVYVTPTGKRYHKNNHCNNGKYTKSTLAEAKKRGLTPCKKCC